MRKVCLLSTVASAHWIKFNAHFRKYFDAEFYFYSSIGDRQKWWKVDLGEHCHVLPCKFKWHSRYMTLSVLKVLREFDPDVVLMSGFSIPANYIAYLWAKRHGKKVAIYSERSRKDDKLRGYTWQWRLLHWLYRKVDLVITTAQDTVPQFRDTFRFGDKVVAGQYPSDIRGYYEHPIRGKKDSYTIIYANRQTDIYNPLAAVRILYGVLKKYPKTRMKMNATGELRPQVEALIAKLGIGNSVEFLDNLKTWEDLGRTYASCDIMILPAKWSDGNYSTRECMASGMMCLVTDRVLGDEPQLLRAMNDDFYLPLDEQRFVDRICKCIEHPESFETIAERNREAMRPFCLDGTAALYSRHINSLFK